jgi:protein-tyrosine-phosphatase
MSTVLCVCTGNLCRSPMAVGLLRERLFQEGVGAQHKVSSAGTWAVDGHPASDHAVAVMAERGIDISDHVAHTITAEDVAEAELILVMSREHAGMIQSTWPQYEWKVYRLCELAGKRRDVADPYGGPIEEYRVCADTIADYVDQGFQRILQLI